MTEKKEGRIMYRIFLVEDDDSIAGSITRHIESWGFMVVRADDYRNILAEFAAVDPQLVLLDISLPFADGYHWCEKIRRVSKVPIIFISSAADNMNIVMAVSAGADDFVAKPFDLSVLTAKIQAVLRRTYAFAGQSPITEINGLLFNREEGALTGDDKKIPLTKNECRILALLLDNKGRVVSRELMMTRLWETDSFVDENTLSVNVARLRKKLDEAGATGTIQTKKGMGYIIE
jgi:two-component system response regulator protein BraR/BceR